MTAVRWEEKDEKDFLFFIKVTRLEKKHKLS